MAQKIYTSIDVKGQTTTDAVQLTTTPVTGAAGKLWYNGSTGSFNVGMGGGNITQQVGEELFIYGKATSIIHDTPLQIIYKTGTVGASGVLSFAPTVAGITDPNLILGCATEDIAVGGFGRITTYGIIHGLATDGTAYGETWVDGDSIWYNPVTGNPTKTKPTAPNIIVFLGIVLNAAGGGAGSFQVELQRGSGLGVTDSNVLFTSLANNDILAYESSTALWKNKSISTVLGYTPANTATTISTTTPLQGGGDLSANRTLSITQATTSTSGYLSSTDWNTFNNKQPAMSFNSPLSYGLGTLSIAQATTSASGYLSSADWNTFNGKQPYITNLITGIVTTGFIPKSTSSTSGLTTLGNSLIYDNGTNIGIGTTSPSYKLDVNGDINSGATIFSNSFNFRSDNFKTSAASVGKFSTLSQGATDFELIFNRSANGTGAYYSIQSVEQGVAYRNLIFQKDGGNVGIGTTSPNFSASGRTVLDINGTSNTMLCLSVGGTAGSYFYQASNNLNISNEVSGAIINYTGGLERLRITSGGNVGIGTTSPNAKLHVEGVIYANTSGFANATFLVNSRNPIWRFGNADAYGISYFQGTTGLSQDTIGFHFGTATAAASVLQINQSGSITTNGNVGIGATYPSYQLQLSTDSAAKPTSALWTIASDERIKENIKPYTKGLKELMLINAITYDYNGLGGFTKGKGGVGIIAQQIKEILPDSVSSISAKLNEDDEEETDILNFNGHELTYILINAVKELQQQINDLKNGN